MKGRVYIETSIVSYLAGRASSDTIVAAHQELTHRWWCERAPEFDIMISELVEQEAGAGDPSAAKERTALLADLPILSVDDQAVALAEGLVASGTVPRQAAADALHIAIAAANGVEYLLTWNCKHLANAILRHRIETAVADAGYACPVICTPEELMED